MAAAASAALYTSPRGYSLTPPLGWHLMTHLLPAPDPGDNLVAFFEQKPASSSDGVGPVFRIKVTPQDGVTLEALKTEESAEKKTAFPGMTLLSQTYSSVGGVRDMDTVLVGPSAIGPIRIHQIYVMKNQSLYIFTAAFSDKLRAKYDPLFARMLASVHWKP